MLWGKMEQGRYTKRMKVETVAIFNRFVGTGLVEVVISGQRLQRGSGASSPKSRGEGEKASRWGTDE